MGILYSKNKGNCKAEDFEKLKEFALEHHLPIMIYDMDAIKNDLNRIRKEMQNMNKLPKEQSSDLDER